MLLNGVKTKEPTKRSRYQELKDKRAQKAETLAEFIELEKTKLKLFYSLSILTLRDKDST